MRFNIDPHFFDAESTVFIIVTIINTSITLIKRIDIIQHVIPTLRSLLRNGENFVQLFRP